MTNFIVIWCLYLVGQTNQLLQSTEWESFVIIETYLLGAMSIGTQLSKFIYQIFTANHQA